MLKIITIKKKNMLNCEYGHKTSGYRFVYKRLTILMKYESVKGR